MILSETLGKMLVENLIYISRIGKTRSAPMRFSQTCDMASVLASLSKVLEARSPVQVVPIFAPNMIAIPKVSDIDSVPTIDWPREIVAAEDWRKTDTIKPLSIPNNEFLSANARHFMTKSC